jgi:ribosomal protein S3AE
VYATTVLAAEMYRKKDNSIDANRTIVTRDGIISKVSFPEDVMAIIDQYRRLVI